VIGMEMNHSAVIVWRGVGGEQNDSFHLGCQIFGLRSRRC